MRTENGTKFIKPEGYDINKVQAGYELLGNYKNIGNTGIRFSS